MKKHLLFIILPLALFFSSCEKNEIVEVIPNRTIVTDISGNSWRLSTDGRRFTTTISVPEITSDFNERGGVLVYISFGDRIYEPIPQVFEGVSYRYDTAPGSILVTVENSDGSGTVTAPPPSTFKIVLIEAEYF